MSEPRILKGPTNNVHIPNVGFHEYILEMVQRNENADFVVEFETERRFTYRQFLNDILKLASTFKKWGVSVGDVFIIYGYNCYEPLVCLIAGLAVGAVGMFIREFDSHYEVQKHVRERNAKVVFVSTTNVGVVEKIEQTCRNRLIYAVFGVDKHSKLKTVRELLKQENDQLKIEDIYKPANSKHTVAMYIMSSGTSGPSKVCMMSHYALVGPNAIGTAEVPGIAMGTPLGHISGLFCFVACVKCKALLVTLSEWDPEKLIESVRKYQLSVTFATPSNIVHITKREPSVSWPSLKAIVHGGSLLHATVAKEFYEKYKPVKLMCFYAMTEVMAIISTTSGDVDMFGSVGKVRPMMEVKIVDPDTDEILGPNKAGEILAKGPCMFLGYHKDPKASEAAFDKDGFIRTGDIGCYDENELLYLIDRRKDIIEQGVWRFPPSDIEAVLLTHEAVKDAAAVGIKVDGGLKAFAFVILKERYQGKAVEDEIKQYANDRLSKVSQIEGDLHFVTAFPVTSTSKVMRKKIAEDYLAYFQTNK